MKLAAMFSSRNVTTSSSNPAPVSGQHSPKKRTMNLEKSFVTQTMTDNSVYVGEWSHSTMNGKGTLVYLNGNILEGNWFHGKLSGEVKITYKNGDSFEGVISKNIVTEGNGVWRALTAEPSEFDYNGAWLNGMFHGFGTKKFEDGMVYKGEWQKNTRHGLGTCTFPDGTTFEGEFFADSREGVGRSCSPEGKVFLGVFSRNNIQSGRGYSVLSDGSVYDGEWAAGSKHGKGVHRLTDGSVYEGTWRKDQLHGPGKITTPTGEVKEGIYEAGVLIGAVGSKVQPALHNLAGLQQGLKHTQSNAVIHAVNNSAIGTSSARVTINATPVRTAPVVEAVTAAVNYVSMPTAIKVSSVHSPPSSSVTMEPAAPSAIPAAVPELTEPVTTSPEVVAPTEPSAVAAPKKRSRSKPFHFTDKDCVYEGGMYNNQRHGHGTLTHSDGYTFQGEFLKGLMNGYGKWSHPRGDYLEGFYSLGQLNGQGSRLVKGESYDGDFMNNLPHGYGVSRDAEGNTYEGDFELGVYHGYGTLKQANGTVTSGEFHKGQLVPKSEAVVSSTVNPVSGSPGAIKTSSSISDGSSSREHTNGVIGQAEIEAYKAAAMESLPRGSVTLTLPEGTYIGDARVNDIRRGYGIMTYHNGSLYIGKWYDNKQSGNGFMYYMQDGKLVSKYSGSWMEGKYHGTGKYFVLSDTGNGDKEMLRTFYEGRFEHGVRTGKGELKINNKTVYKGDFANDQFHGQGYQTDQSTEYTGEFKNGQRHGKGMLSYSNSPGTKKRKPFVGTFKNNLPCTGTGSVVRPTGIFEGKLVEGKEEGPGQFTSLEDKSVIKGVWANGELLPGIFCFTILYMYYLTFFTAVLV